MFFLIICTVIICLKPVTRGFIVAQIIIDINISVYRFGFIIIVFIIIGKLIIKIFFQILFSIFQRRIFLQFLLNALFKSLGRQLNKLHQLDLLWRELLG